VADDTSSTPRPFDAQTVKELIQLMRRYDLSEIDLREGDLRICLRRGPLVPAAPPAAPPPAAEPAKPPAAAPEPAKPGKALVEIKSPGPGTFYVSPNPGADPFIRAGMRVAPTTVVGILEAMKLFTEIPADCSGVVTEILVENQQPVEYNQVLFRVDPSG
jgi:acetyl-CoA carboxylase biotin carboxyl carrier protein